MDKEVILDNDYVTMWFYQDKKIYALLIPSLALTLPITGLAAE